MEVCVKCVVFLNYWCKEVIRSSCIMKYGKTAKEIDMLKLLLGMKLGLAKYLDGLLPLNVP